MRIRVLLALLGFLSPGVWACSCAPGSLEAHFDRAFHVFTTRVETVAPSQDHDRQLKVSHQVMTTFKGDPESLTLVTRDNGGSCGFGFTPGESYLLFADKNGRVGLCAGNSGLREARLNNRVLALERFVDNQTDRIVEPWVGRASDKWDRRRHVNCRLSVGLTSAIMASSITGSLAVSAAYDKRYHAHRIPTLTVSVPIPLTAPDGEVDIVMDGATYALHQQEESYRRETFAIKGIETLDFARSLHAGSQVTIGPFRIDYSRVSKSDLQRLTALPDDQYVTVPMENLDPAPQTFFDCVEKLQDRFDFRGAYRDPPVGP